MAANTTATSASERALRRPEILEKIIWIEATGWTRGGKNLTTPESRLLRSALVNKFWCEVAIPHLWGPWGVHDLVSRLKRLDGYDRRQFYANHMKSASIYTVHLEEYLLLCELNFPKLTKVEIFVRHIKPFPLHMGYGDFVDEPTMPRIRADNVKELVFNPHEDRERRKVPYEVLQKFPPLFPRLNILSIDMGARISLLDVKRLERELPLPIVRRVPLPYWTDPECLENYIQLYENI